MCLVYYLPGATTTTFAHRSKSLLAQNQEKDDTGSEKQVKEESFAV